jgi:hypothetical protein
VRRVTSVTHSHTERQRPCPQSVPDPPR